MSLQITVNEKVVAAAEGMTLFECAEQVDVRVPTSCVKQGKCRECLVEVQQGMEFLTPRDDHERHLEGTFRLSCRARVSTTEGLIQCHTLRRGSLRVVQEGNDHPSSAVQKKLDPAVTRDGCKVLLDGEVIDEPEFPGPLLGMAIDIGTTTVVARLIDLESGDLLAVQSFENPQRFGGSDVMARIRYDTENRGKLLQRTLLGYLAHMIEDLPCDPGNIYEIVIAGNSTVRDLFFGLSVKGIGQKPYHSITEDEFREGKRPSTMITATGKSLRLPIHPRARVVGLPLISGHVGADAAACMLAIDLANEEKTVALMDIGTNTELIVGHKGKILAASCPAGPAFEGGQVSCGVPALDGAIERVAINDKGEFELETVQGAPPNGICGSGLIDLLGELLRTKRINEKGRFEDGSDRVNLDGSGKIYIRENDISLLAQAKGAHVAGVRIVCDKFGVEVRDLDRFYLAGGFATHIEIDAARRIGLIPDLPDEKILRIGNAAIEGATMALCSASTRRLLDQLVKQVEHVELETHPDFFDYFVDGCLFERYGGA